MARTRLELPATTRPFSPILFLIGQRRHAQFGVFSMGASGVSVDLWSPLTTPREGKKTQANLVWLGAASPFCLPADAFLDLNRL